MSEDPRGHKRGPEPPGRPYRLAAMQPVSADDYDLCVRRTYGLLTDAHRPLQDLLANAYWLGLKDAAEVSNAE